MYNVCTALYNAVVSVYEQQMLIKRPKRGFLFIINIILSVKMPNTCCSVPYCHNKGGHAFPKDQALRKKWIIAIKRDKWIPTKTAWLREHSCFYFR